MAELLTVEAMLALLTLASLEIVLGIDNLVFLSILTGKLPKHQQASAQRWGLILAMAGRVALLFAITWIMRLDRPLFSVLEMSFSGRDLILLGGGLFLLAKGTWEIHENLEGPASHEARKAAPNHASYASVIVQVLMMDAVFSIDSVVTAVGMTGNMADTPTARLIVMITAIVIAIVIMLAFAGTLSRFIERHPTMKMLALSFLLLVGVLLVADGFGQHIDRGYIYFAMGFSLFVELLNLRFTRRPATREAGEAAEKGAE